MKKFWNFVKNEETSETELLFNGPISEESWYGDEVTPKLFRDELAKVSGNLTVWLNSPGGDVFAASQIYTMLRNHKGKVTVKIDALAASAASVVAMAGDETFIAPTAMLMIHDPATIAMGNKSDMEKAITLLEEVKESIINAYEMKTHLSRSKIAKMMSDETWLNAKKALQLSFVDGILFAKEKMPQAEPEEDEEESCEEKSEEDTPDEDENPDEEEKKPPKDMVSFSYTPSRTVASFMQKVSANPTGTPIAQLDKRLELLKYRPYYTSTFVPEIAAGNKIMAFGDFKYYWIADRQGRSFKRLNELFSMTGQVGFLASQHVDGKLILPEAIKTLTVKG